MLGNYNWAQNLLGQNTGYQQIQNGQLHWANQNLAQQQYNQILQGNLGNLANKPVWMFDGIQCNVRTFADKVWPNSCPDKTHFLLKYE